MKNPDKEFIADWFKLLQDDICEQLEDEDGQGRFKEDQWEREGGGGGRTRIINNGKIIEKGGVNFSAVHGKTPGKILKALQLDESDFFATGVSIVIHPHNPFVPIIHMNVRYFEMTTASGNPDEGKWWFGGGIDLTPHYVDEEDAKYFHGCISNACKKHDSAFYQEFKKWADDYFFIKHRNETRGIGGIFFDQLNNSRGKSKSELFDFVKDIANLFAPMYRHFMRKNTQQKYSDKEKEWQLLRRGRYVEFNLVYDKGTKFGLDTNGRTESILMSLPSQANWVYDFKPAKGSLEEKTVQLLQKGINWIEYA